MLRACSRGSASSRTKLGTRPDCRKSAAVSARCSPSRCTSASAILTRDKIGVAVREDIAHEYIRCRRGVILSDHHESGQATLEQPPQERYARLRLEPAGTFYRFRGPGGSPVAAQIQRPDP